MENENGGGPEGRGPGEEWARGTGAGAAGRSPYGSSGPPNRGWGEGQRTTAFPTAPYPGTASQSQQPGQTFPPGQAYPQGQTFPPGQAFPPGQPGGAPQVGSGKSGRGLLAAGVVAAMLVSGGLGGWIGASVAGSGTTGLASPISASQPVGEAPDGTVEAVADKVLPSVVSIDVRGEAGRGEGSGVVLTTDGLIITNNHVIGMAAAGGRIQVRFDDGTKVPASVVGTDPATDVAVIKVEKSTPLNPIALGSSASLTEGQAVAAVGSPLGLSGTVTTGIVSALNRPVRAGGEQSDQSTVIDAIQTDAAVNPGNSGGALVNMNGELVGINSAIASMGSGSSGSIGLGFAIPVDQARRIADQLIKQGYATRAVLGVAVSDSPEGDGSLVRSVEAGGPADRAGIKEGAVITQVGDRLIEGGDSLVAAIRSRAPGDTISVTYAAGVGEEPITVDVVLGEAR
ncbi:trypsin-like peptidase domain-containing protein [Dietzia alimentaria]|uniref:trypsin-like peptidase domain-containing protein n=1 Tax=Dietzia alimentaria TaxID=665550 RepID=UPI0011457387|nr:trypsin-like peptidase domain-containing protein [Dietzia alimentaria]